MDVQAYKAKNKAKSCEAKRFRGDGCQKAVADRYRYIHFSTVLINGFGCGMTHETNTIIGVPVWKKW
jgi:hypothetical protein